VVRIISYEDEQTIYRLLPSTITVDGQTFSIKKVAQAYKLPDYVGPTIAIQYVNEFGLDYQSIEQGYEEIDSYSFSLSKDYKTVLLVTVAADDTAPLQKSVTFTYAGSTVPDEPYKTIISVTPSTPVLGEPVTVVYTRIIRGYNIVRTIMRAIYDLADYEFPVEVTLKGQTRDVSELVGRETLCVLQGTLVLKNEYTSVHSFPEENTPVEALEIDIECNS
jgi:hypothetical protein